MCAAGHEFGVTTGRKRRCGWFDAVIGRYAAEVNGLTDVALTKLDVLSAFDTIKVCVAYECDGVRYDYFPMQQSVLHHAKPIYVELPGWKDEDITGCRHLRGAAGEHAQVHRVFGRGVRRAHEHHLGWPRPRPDDYPHVLVERRVVGFVRLGRRTIKPTLRFRLAPALAIQRFPSRPEGRSAALQGNCRHQSEPR